MSKNILNDYQQFNNLNEMNESVSAHIENNYLNTNTVKVLEYLARISSHYLGATRVLQATIADKLGVSLSTVKRAVRALEQASIITVYRQRRKSLFGGSCSSIYVINKADYEEIGLQHEPQHELPPSTKKEVVKTTAPRDFKKDELVFTYLYTNNLVNTNLLTEAQIYKVYKSFPNLSKTLFNKIVLEFNKQANNKQIKNAVAYLKGMISNSLRHIEKRSQRDLGGYTETLKGDNPLALFGRMIERKGSLNVTL